MTLEDFALWEAIDKARERIDELIDDLELTNPERYRLELARNALEQAKIHSETYEVPRTSVQPKTPTYCEECNKGVPSFANLFKECSK